MTIKETGPAEAVDQDAFILTDDDIYGIYGPGFFFDMKVKNMSAVCNFPLNHLFMSRLDKDLFKNRCQGV